MRYAQIATLAATIWLGGCTNKDTGDTTDVVDTPTVDGTETDADTDADADTDTDADVDTADSGGTTFPSGG